MAHSRTDDFIDALHRLETEGDVETIVDLFSPEAELRNPTHRRPEHGKDGARHFWETYRGTLGGVHSRFSKVIESDHVAMLEWTSEGETPDGRQITYDGISVLEFDDDGAIRRFRAYFDPSRLGHELKRH